MADVYATRSGNWDAPSIWNTNSVPTITDTVYANTYTVSISTDVGAASVTTRAGSSPIAANGRFALLANSTLSADVYAGPSVDSAGTLYTSIIFPNTCRLVGHAYFNIMGVGNYTAIKNNSTGIMNISGCIVNQAPAVEVVSTAGPIVVNNGTMAIQGSVDGSNNGDGGSRIIDNQSNLFVYGDIKRKINRYCPTVSNVGYFYLQGNIFGDTGFSNNDATVKNFNTGSIEVSGNLYGSGSVVNDVVMSPAGGSVLNTCISNTSTSTVRITGTIYGGSASAPTFGHWSSGSVYINGTVIGGIGPAISNSYFYGTTQFAGTGPIYIKRAKGGQGGPKVSIAQNFTGPGISAGRDGVVYVEEMEFGDQGASPINGPVFVTNLTNSVVIMRGAYPDLTPTTFFGGFAIPGLFPPVSSVRLGVIYSNGDLVGTMAVPPPQAVQLGVPVDNTLGTFIITPESFWTLSRSSTAFSNPASIGYRVKNIATIPAVGQLLGSFSLEKDLRPYYA